ncbi:hypothetical protein Tco_0637963 [Tanacetum coccineum]
MMHVVGRAALALHNFALPMVALSLYVASYKSDEMVIEVFFGSCFFFCPLNYPGGQIIDLRLPRSSRMPYKEMIDLLLDKTKDDIWKWFYCKPKCKLEKGLTLVEKIGTARKYLSWLTFMASTSKGKVVLDDFQDVANRKCKVVLDDFMNVGNGKGKVVLDESKDGLAQTKGDGDPTVGGSSSYNLY